jgi:DNA-binding CsgD family transcriptional regulator
VREALAGNRDLLAHYRVKTDTVGRASQDAGPSAAARRLSMPMLLDGPLGQQQPGLESLTPGERRILAMVADGRSSKDIGAALFIHHRSVENHRTNICQKLGLSGPHALLTFALAHRHEL